jgi:hypothetical protein
LFSGHWELASHTAQRRHIPFQKKMVAGGYFL